MSFSLVAQPTIVCEEPCECQYRDGLFYTIDPALDVIRAFRPATFYRNFQSAAKAIQAYHAKEGDEADVIQFPGRANRH